MRSPYLRRPPLPAMTILAVFAGSMWLAAVISRALDFIGVPWWVVVSPPLVVAALFVLAVAGALAVTTCYALALRWSERRERVRREREARRIREFFVRGHHLQDRRHEPPHRW